METEDYGSETSQDEETASFKNMLREVSEEEWKRKRLF